MVRRDYDGIFRDPAMFNSKRTFSAAGFDVRQAASHNIMVGRHPSVERYIFKKYNRDVPQGDQEDNYRTRVRGAAKIRRVIDRYRLRHVVVPHKFIYELPRQFDHRRDISCVLVAERFDLLNADESAHRYRTVDREVIDDLCRVLYEFRGFDAAIHNLPFTTSGKIAFIDTESWDRSPRDGTRVFRRIGKELSDDMRRHVRRSFESFES